MARPRPHPARGLTLVEVIVALAVTAIVLVGVLASFRAQQATFYGTQKVRAAQASARSALLYLEQKLPLAGLGMDGSLAFDFSGYTTGPCPAELAPCRADSTTDSDEVTFFARDSSYWVPADLSADGRGNTWFFRQVAGNTLTLTAREGDRFEKGQILQVVCQLKVRYAYVTVDEGADGPADDGNPATTNTADLTLTLQPGDPNAPNPFRTQFLTTDPCFTAATGSARVFRIDRYRLHVRPLARPDGRYDPYLMLDTGLDQNRDGTLDEQDEIPIADGIENLQLAYSFENVALGTYGMNPGTPITFVASPANSGQTADQIGTLQLPSVASVAAPDTPFTVTTFLRYRSTPPNLPAERLSNHQGNVTSVRVGVIARSPEPSTSTTATFRLANHELFNFVGAPAWVQDFASARGGDDGYQRFQAETTLNTPNLLVQVVPPF